MAGHNQSENSIVVNCVLLIPNIPLVKRHNNAYVCSCKLSYVLFGFMAYQTL